MKTIFHLKNPVQHYAWGSTEGIPRVTGITNDTGKPMAELWMGTHPAAPSLIISDAAGKEESLSSVVNLPFLFKILSAATPLSLQVHPTLAQAREGFERENNAGIDLSSPTRNYKDANHKPEIIVALTPFQAMCGFRPVAETVALLRELHSTALTDSLTRLEGSGNYGKFLSFLLNADTDTVQSIAASIREAVQNTKTEYNQVFSEALNTASRLLDYYPSDIGILAPFYLNLINLAPLESLYLPAGIIHAYLQGTGFELMSSSDNVLRGGLTPKHIDIEELLAIVDPSPYEPPILHAQADPGLSSYPTPAEDFFLAFNVFSGPTLTYECSEPAIMICQEGKISVKRFPDEEIVLEKGNSCYIAASRKTLSVSGQGTLWVATKPGGIHLV